jgi:hypothetical protein
VGFKEVMGFLKLSIIIIIIIIIIIMKMMIIIIIIIIIIIGRLEQFQNYPDNT